MGATTDYIFTESSSRSQLLLYISSSILGFIYPITFALVIYVVIFGDKIKSKTPYFTALLITALISLFNVFEHFNIAVGKISYYKSYIPLASQNLEWILPSFLGFMIAYFISKKIKKSSFQP